MAAKLDRQRAVWTAVYAPVGAGVTAAGWALFRVKQEGQIREAREDKISYRTHGQMILSYSINITAV